MIPRHLVVPGLLAPWPGEEPPPLPALETLLARGRRRRGGDGFEAVLFELFEVPPEARGAAAWRWLGRTGAAPGGGVVQAHPVHYRADRDRLLLFALPPLPEDEAAALADTFNQHFGDRALALHPGAPWLVQGPQLKDTRFVPLSEVDGRPLDGALPEGAGGPFWQGVLNETQMLFFDHPVNQARQARGELEVNGLWFDHPGSRLAERTAPLGIEAEEDDLAAGLAARAGEGPPRGRLYCDTRIATARLRQDPHAWRRALLALEERVATWQQASEPLVLHPCDGRSFLWTPAARRRFWRRRRPLAAYFNAPA